MLELTQLLQLLLCPSVEIQPPATDEPTWNVTTNSGLQAPVYFVIQTHSSGSLGGDELYIPKCAFDVL